MGYMTFWQQKAKHLKFLSEAGLEVTNLVIDSTGFTRSWIIRRQKGGDYAYKTVSRKLNNGMTGLITWCRGLNGQISTCKTYGLPPDGSESTSCTAMVEKESVFYAASDAIQKFWDLSLQYGESDYLKKKGVGAYRIRFRDNQYGKVAVVPIRDVKNKLCSYQILNSNGSKAFAKGSRLSGFFHRLTELVDGSPIGIAESYVTAATCLEITGLPMVTAFTSGNLERVAVELRQEYLNSSLVIFADNDRHLVVNKGVCDAEKAYMRCNGAGAILIPNFYGYPRTREYSDWNDLVREIGSIRTLEQIQQSLPHALQMEIVSWKQTNINKSIDV
jgi:phage/plasmid primase-like uncharacterized protein